MKTISKLKKELDKYFSLYIRLRSATDEGLVQCFTCQKVSNYKSGMQNGHFQSRKNYATRWDPLNCMVQCYGCNIMKHGEQYKFGLKLDKDFGDGTAEKLLIKSKQIVKFSNEDLESLITYYNIIVNKLM